MITLFKIPTTCTTFIFLTTLYDGCSSTALLHRRLYNRNVTTATAKESGPQSASRPRVIHSAGREKDDIIIIKQTLQSVPIIVVQNVHVQGEMSKSRQARRTTAAVEKNIIS